MVYPPLLLLMRTPRLPVVDWTDAPSDLNRLVRFAERRNVVSARVPSHFKRSLTKIIRWCVCVFVCLVLLHECVKWLVLVPSWLKFVFWKGGRGSYCFWLSHLRPHSVVTFVNQIFLPQFATVFSKWVFSFELSCDSIFFLYFSSNDNFVHMTFLSLFYVSTLFTSSIRDPVTYWSKPQTQGISYILQII